MSHPKSGGISVRNATAAERRERARRRRERQEREIAAADAERRARMKRTEERLRRLEELAAERDARREKLRREQSERLAAAERERESAYRRRIRDRAAAAITDIEQVARWLSGLPFADRGSRGIAKPVLAGEPADGDARALEDWCAGVEARAAGFRKDALKLVESEASRAGGAATEAALRKGIASGDLSAEAALAAAGLALAFPSGRESRVQDEAKRIRQLFETAARLSASRALGREAAHRLHAAVQDIGNAESQDEFISRRQALVALVTAADDEIRRTQSLVEALSALAGRWSHETGDPEPPELRERIEAPAGLKASSVDEWKERMAIAASRFRERRQREEGQGREVERQLIEETLRQVLENRGYEVEEIGHSLFTGGGKMFATRPEWRGHFVELSGSEEGGALGLRTRCVRDPAAAQEADESVDSAWCDDLHAAIPVLRDAGVAFRIDSVDRSAPAVDVMEEAESGREFVRSRRDRGTTGTRKKRQAARRMKP